MNGPRIIGLDLAAECSGVALPDGTTTTIRAPKAAGKKRTLADDLARLGAFGREICELLVTHTPTLAVIEDYAPGIRSAAAHRLAEISGVARYECHLAGVPVVLVNVTQLKVYATGKAGAKKSEMATSALSRAGRVFDTEDECDAWWLWAAAMDHLGHPVVNVPKAHRAVLANIAWPEPAGLALFPEGAASC